MSGVKNDPDHVYEIDQDTFNQINDIVHKVATRYTTWQDFVDDAVRTFATWWNNPPAAISIFTQVLWPHMTDEQREMLKDPKYGGVQTYEKLRKEAEEYHIENGTLDPQTKRYSHPVLKVDTEVEKDALETLKEKEYLQYTIKARRVYDIEKIVKTAKNVSGDRYYETWDGFMRQTIHLFINYWSDPYANQNEMCEMIPYLTKKQCRLWYNLDPSKDGNYMTWKKLAEEYHKKIGRKMIMDDGIDLDEKTGATVGTGGEIITKEVIHADPRGKRTENYVEIEDLLQHTAEIKKQIKNMDKNKMFKKPADALLTDPYPLIRQFYNRFFPVKLTLTVLAKMINDENGEPIDYSDFREEVFPYIVDYSRTLKDLEKKKGLDRTKKNSTGLPLPRPSFPNNASKEQQQEYAKLVMKWESSKERFLEQYIGPTKKQWEKKNKKANGSGVFDGALNSMNLISITKDNYGGLKINFTKKGAGFYDIPNDLLDNFPNIQLEKHKPISRDECVFLMENVIKKKPFDQEKKLVDELYVILKGADNEYVFGSELDDKYEEVFVEFANAQEIDEGKMAQDFWKVARQATMGRLSEMGLVDWVIYGKDMEASHIIGDVKFLSDRTNRPPPGPEKYGKSCYKLNEQLKNIW